MRDTWRKRIKHVVSPGWLNSTLLRFPFLYSTPLLEYETNLIEDHGIEDLLGQLRTVISLQGDVIECGSSRCGASILMALTLRNAGVSKMIWACDSFEGFDREELRSERERGLTTVGDDAFTSTSYSYVCQKLRALGMDDIVKPVQGYFANTLPSLDVQVCFALVDCDLKRSLMYCGEQIWPRLVPGGRIVFDDYNCPDFQGARRGIDEFIRGHSTEVAQSGLLHRLYYVVKRQDA